MTNTEDNPISSMWLKSIGGVEERPLEIRFGRVLVLRCDCGQWVAYSNGSSHWHKLVELVSRKEARLLMRALKLDNLNSGEDDMTNTDDAYRRYCAEFGLCNRVVFDAAYRMGREDASRKDMQPITEEWLLSIGFNEVESDRGPSFGNHFQKSRINIWEFNDTGRWLLNGCDKIEMTFRHELLALLDIIGDQ